MDVIAKNSYPVWHGHNTFEYGMTVYGIQQAINETPTIIPADVTDTNVGKKEETGL